MTDRPSTPDWPHEDNRWQSVTYLDYINARPREQFEFALNQVNWTTLAPNQPQEFADFSSCTMHWNLDELDLDEHRRRDLLLGMASNGVRVPGTGFVFRVARPWYALFEERQGDFPALPNDWMEVVHVRKSGFSGRYEWIGRRHKQAEWVVRWSLYEETPSGWRLKPRPLPQLPQERLRLEIDRVLAEIDELQNRLIPEMVERDPPIFLREPASKSPRWTDKLRSEGEWRHLVGGLRAILAAELSALPRCFDFEAFRPATWVEPTIDYSVEPDRIRWQISCFGSFDWADLINWTVLPDECRPRNPDDVAGPLDAIKRWMLNGSPHNLILWDALVGVLPMIADREPEFAWKVLDVNHWHRRAEEVHFASDAHRRDSLAVVHSRRVLHDSLVNVIAALANNNFDQIRFFLDHHEFVGRNTLLVPRNLLAILCAKVYVLQQLCPNTSILGPNRRFLGWSVR